MFIKNIFVLFFVSCIYMINSQFDLNDFPFDNVVTILAVCDINSISSEIETLIDIFENENSTASDITNLLTDTDLLDTVCEEKAFCNFLAGDYGNPCCLEYMVDNLRFDELGDIDEDTQELIRDLASNVCTKSSITDEYCFTSIITSVNETLQNIDDENFSKDSLPICTNDLELNPNANNCFNELDVDYSEISDILTGVLIDELTNLNITNDDDEIDIEGIFPLCPTVAPTDQPTTSPTTPTIDTMAPTISPTVEGDNDDNSNNLDNSSTINKLNSSLLVIISLLLLNLF